MCWGSLSAYVMIVRTRNFGTASIGVTRPDQWLSVVVFGDYEELPDTPKYKFERNLAYKILRQRVMWWEPASVASPHHSAADSLVPVFYRIHIDKVTGHHPTPDRD